MELEYARSFRDLLVYQRAFQVAKRIFEAEGSFMYSGADADDPLVSRESDQI
jgi:hypothetical protein